MNSRERIATVLSGGIPDRVPIHDGFWKTTVDRWRREGMPQGISPHDFFGLEMVWISGDWSLQLPERVLSQDAQSRTYWDEMGALRSDLHTEIGWTSQWRDYSIKTQDDWLRYRHLMAYNPSRIPASAMAAYDDARAKGCFVCYQAHGCFHPTWMKIGMEQEMMWLIDQPEWMHDMFAVHTTLILDLFDAMSDMGMAFDGALIADDLGYQAGPLISPRLYREMVYPHHRRVCDHLAERGLKALLHSDGNVASLIPHFIEAGFAGLHPLEAKAGMDVRQLKPQYGSQLVLFGNIDVRKLSGTREEIEEEIASKVPVAKQDGGYIYHSDHSVPNSVSFENYCFALECIKRYGAY
jgi:uroporphyrinogen decarboxylase